MKLRIALLAATTAGLLASSLMLANARQNVEATAIKAPPIASLSVDSNTILVLKQCNINLPTMEMSIVADDLEDWAPLWLMTNKNRSMENQNALCSNILSAALQVKEEDYARDKMFEPMTSVVNTMMNQVGEVTLEDKNIAGEVALLMGLNLNDTLDYFRELKTGVTTSLPACTAPLDNEKEGLRVSVLLSNSEKNIREFENSSRNRGDESESCMGPL